MGDHCNPIIGLHDSIALNFLSVNVPFTKRWTDKSCSLRIDNIDVEEISEEKLTCDFILKKYKKLFTGIGCFKCAQAEIQAERQCCTCAKATEEDSRGYERRVSGRNKQYGKSWHTNQVRQKPSN